MTNLNAKEVGYAYQNGLYYICYSNGTACFNGFCDVKNKKGIFSTVPIYNILDHVALKEVCLPDFLLIDGQQYRVTAIAASSFSACRELETIIIPKTVEKIEWNMLYLEHLRQIKVDEENPFFKDISHLAIIIWFLFLKEEIKIRNTQYKYSRCETIIVPHLLYRC